MMRILREILWFVFHRPSPDESLIMRLAMLIMALAGSVACVVTAVQLHWAFFVVFGFAALSWGTLFYTWKMMRDARFIQLTPAARAFLDHFPLESTQRVRLQMTYGTAGEKLVTIAVVDSFDREMDCELRPHGIPFVVDRSEAPYLEETMIDYISNEQGEGFHVFSPKLSS